MCLNSTLLELEAQSKFQLQALQVLAIDCLPGRGIILSSKTSVPWKGSDTKSDLFNKSEKDNVCNFISGTRLESLTFWFRWNVTRCFRIPNPNQWRRYYTNLKASCHIVNADFLGNKTSILLIRSLFWIFQISNQFAITIKQFGRDFPHLYNS